MPRSASVRLYASVGPELTHYDVDVEGAELVRRGAVTLPANVHYAWPHTSRRFLYIPSSEATANPARPGEPAGGIMSARLPSTWNRARSPRTARRSRCRPA